MAVSGRIDSGAIPFKMEDLRCSYCFVSPRSFHSSVADAKRSSTAVTEHWTEN